MTPPIRKQVTRSLKIAAQIASQLGAHTLDEDALDDRLYLDEFIQIELGADDLAISSFTVMVYAPIAENAPFRIAERPYITVLRTQDQELEIYRPDIPLANGKSWVDYLEQLHEAAESVKPEPQNPVEFLSEIADTPSVEVENHLIHLDSLRSMGVKAADWMIALLKRITSLPVEQRTILLTLLNSTKPKAA